MGKKEPCQVDGLRELRKLWLPETETRNCKDAVKPFLEGKNQLKNHKL